jgi:hypothetical protein
MNKYLEFYQKLDRENVYSSGMIPKEYKFNNVLTIVKKIYKESIHIRENILIRLSYVIPKRVYCLLKFVLKPNLLKKIVYKKIKANYDIF